MGNFTSLPVSAELAAKIARVERELAPLGLDRIEALANAADVTSQPWSVAGLALLLRFGDKNDGPWNEAADDVEYLPRSRADAALIVALAAGLPALVAELRAARADLTVAAADRDLYRDLYRQVYDAVAGESLGNLPTRDIVAAAVAHREAHAEIERLRTAAADERADVIAKACVLAEYLTRDHMPDDDKHAGHMIYTLAEEFERGAHVGAANGGDHG